MNVEGDIQFEILSQYVPWVTGKDYETPITIASLRAQLWTRDLLNSKQK